MKKIETKFESDQLQFISLKGLRHNFLKSYLIVNCKLS